MNQYNPTGCHHKAAECGLVMTRALPLISEQIGQAAGKQTLNRLLGYY